MPRSDSPLRMLLTWGCSVLALASMLASCTPTYPADQLETSIKKILNKEYGITNVDVKIAGKTLGVYVPLEKLFSANLDTLTGNQEATMENLFKFNPTAMERVEDVLFTTSRVILSTDRPIDFYVLKAVETKTTGIELSLTGYVEDMKRVRFWDISLDEYRKRLLHDLAVNRTIVWKRTVEDFFAAIGHLPTVDIVGTYFLRGAKERDISPFFYAQLSEARFKKNLVMPIETIKTKPISEREVLVYVKARESYVPEDDYEQYHFLFSSGETWEYLFVLQAQKLSYRIKQVIPFYFIDGERTVHRVDFPEQLKIYDSIKSWSDEFELEEVTMPDFLARQLTKRLQALLAFDPRILQAFDVKKVTCEYVHAEAVPINPGEDQGRFIIHSDFAPLATAGDYKGKPVTAQEEYAHVYALMLKECATVFYSYRFRDVGSVTIIHDDGSGELYVPADVLEALRTKKTTIDNIVATQMAVPPDDIE